MGIKDQSAAADGYEDYVSGVVRKPYVGLDGLKNIQRFMKLRNPKIAELNLEKLIDESLLARVREKRFPRSAIRRKVRSQIIGASVNEEESMAIDGMKVIDLDSHLVGDLESWDQTSRSKV